MIEPTMSGSADAKSVGKAVSVQAPQGVAAAA